MGSLKLKIITPTKVLHDTSVIMFTAPGCEGEFGILAGHIPLLISLKTGYIKLYNDQDEITEKIFIPSGLCQVKNDECTVFIEEAINLKDIKKQEIEEQIENYKKEILEVGEDTKLLFKLQSQIESLETIKLEASRSS